MTAINKTQVQTVVKEFTELMTKGKGAQIHLQGKGSQELIEAISGGNAKKFITQMKKPSFDYNAQMLERGPQVDALIKDGEEVVANVKAEIKLPEEGAEEWLTQVVNFIKRIERTKTPKIDPIPTKYAQDLEKYGVAVREDGLAILKEDWGGLHDPAVLSKSIKDRLKKDAERLEKYPEHNTEIKEGMESLKKASERLEEYLKTQKA